MILSFGHFRQLNARIGAGTRGWIHVHEKQSREITTIEMKRK